LSYSYIDLVASAVQNLRRIRDTYRFISDSRLADLLYYLASSETLVTVPIEIKTQNAAVIVSKQEAGADVIFEIFELSPPNETVMRTKGSVRHGGRELHSAKIHEIPGAPGVEGVGYASTI
jgi:hypothetical protein